MMFLCLLALLFSIQQIDFVIVKGQAVSASSHRVLFIYLFFSHRVLAFNGKKGVLSPETINQSKKDSDGL